MFCPKCGNKDVVDVFCAKCLREQQPLVASFKPFEVNICTACHRIFHRGHWSEGGELGARLAELLAEHVVPARASQVIRIRAEPFPVALKSGLKVEGETLVTVTGRASSKTQAYDEEYSFPYSVQNTLCGRCGKLGTQYFEGVLQLRNEDEESRGFLLEAISRAGASIAKTEHERNGTDYYLTTNAATERVALALQERFGGSIKRSARLFSRNHLTSRDLYRMSILLVLPAFREGDVVVAEGNVLVVKQRGKRIKFYNPLRNKHEFHEHKTFSWTPLSTFETTVASTRPALSVLHPETFQPVRVANLVPKKHEAGDRVRACEHDSKIYIIER